jgi:hypothetical protein
MKHVSFRLSVYVEVLIFTKRTFKILQHLDLNSEDIQRKFKKSIMVSIFRTCYLVLPCNIIMWHGNSYEMLLLFYIFRYIKMQLVSPVVREA